MIFARSNYLAVQMLANGVSRYEGSYLVSPYCVVNILNQLSLLFDRDVSELAKNKEIANHHEMREFWKQNVPTKEEWQFQTLNKLWVDKDYENLKENTCKTQRLLATQPEFIDFQTDSERTIAQSLTDIGFKCNASDIKNNIRSKMMATSGVKVQPRWAGRFYSYEETFYQKKGNKKLNFIRGITPSQVKQIDRNECVLLPTKKSNFGLLIALPSIDIHNAVFNMLKDNFIERAIDSLINSGNSVVSLPEFSCYMKLDVKENIRSCGLDMFFSYPGSKLTSLYLSEMYQTNNITIEIQKDPLIKMEIEKRTDLSHLKITRPFVYFFVNLKTRTPYLAGYINSFS